MGDSLRAARHSTPAVAAKRSGDYSAGGAANSMRMDALERATGRVRSVQRRLQLMGEYDPFAVPPRPKGMQATTYERILVPQPHLYDRRVAPKGVSPPACDAVHC